MPGTDRQPSQPSSMLLAEGRQLGIDEHREGHRIRIRVARIGLDAENHHAQPHPDLRRSKPRAIEIAHGVPHIGEQGLELRRAEFAHRFGDTASSRGSPI
jgi:hypothetical protein